MTYDLVIIGGGINGCALARLAAVNGFSVALLEKNDFGSGVTSRSTRLIHGGLRYLESGRIGLVKESLNDRQALLREYPGQVKPQAFLIPVYQSDSRRPFYISIGLHIYKWLAGDLELGEFQRLSAREVSALAPALDTKDLLAGFLYRDCQAVYPERLSLEMALQAEEAGAEIHNHAAVEGFLIESRRVEGVRVRGLDGRPTLRARLVINAAGPWVDKVRPALPESARKPLVARLNGTHIVVRPFAGAASSAVYHEARSDRRPFFVIPWRGLLLIGATETPFHGDPDRVTPAEHEIAYLLEEANGLFPGAHLTRKSVLYAYAGSRPLLHGRGGSMNAASRDHSIYDHEKEEGLKGLLTLLGGKLTTAPSFAREVLTAASKKLGAPPPRQPGKAVSLQGVSPRLAELYGPRAPRVADFIQQLPGGSSPAVQGAETTMGEIVFAVEHEKARTLGDIMFRRTGLAFDPAHNSSWPRQIAEIAARSRGWAPTDADREVAEYQHEREEFLFGSTLERDVSAESESSPRFSPLGGRSTQ